MRLKESHLLQSKRVFLFLCPHVHLLWGELCLPVVRLSVTAAQHKYIIAFILQNIANLSGFSLVGEIYLALAGGKGNLHKDARASA